VYLPSTPDLVLKLATSPSITSDEGYKLKLQLVINVMKAVHLASAAEAMSLGMKAGLELNTMFEIIGTAAGSSAMFLNRIPGLLSGKWSTEKTIDEVIAELVCISLISPGVRNADIGSRHLYKKPTGSSILCILRRPRCSYSSW
jgi:hypothetical protein